MITNIRLQNFRSYADASFEFEPGVNIIVGPNASGKTNLLEAILMISRGKSYRAKDNELILHNQPWARIDADMASKHRTVKLEQQNEAVKKSFNLDDKLALRLTPQKQIPVVLFEPNHLLMLSGSPELRRSFIDTLIEQTNHTYGTILNKYKRVLLQRNRLLKNSGHGTPSQLFAWDIRLSELGEQIVTARCQMIGLINQGISQTYNLLAHQKNQLEVRYGQPTKPNGYASYMLNKLEQDKQLDLLRGFTGAGPHREDIIFTMNNQPLITTASRGEVRTTLLALKIIELKTIQSQAGENPILLLDDVFSELDGTRRQALAEFMKDHQTFITTTDADVIGKNFAKHTNMVLLN